MRYAETGLSCLSLRKVQHTALHYAAGAVVPAKKYLNGKESDSHPSLVFESERHLLGEINGSKGLRIKTTRMERLRKEKRV